MTFIRVYRLEQWRYSQSRWCFQHIFVNCGLSTTFSLVQVPSPCVNKYTAYTYTVCQGGMGFWASKTDKHLPLSPLTGHFFKWRYFALPSMSLIFL